MSNFIKSSAEQELGRLVNLDLVTCIKKGDDKIIFSFDKENFISWRYDDLKILESDYILIESQAHALVNWAKVI